MAEMINAVDLLIDEENPRILEPNSGQHKAVQALAQNQGRKLPRLARDIIEHGLNPSELPIVMPHSGDPKRYVVLEGNRRLAVLKALENPEVLVGGVDAAIITDLRKLSQEYQKNPIDSVECHVVKDRDEAQHWIELRHTGINDGAGIVPWGSDEAARFRARTGELEVHQQALDFLQRRGDLSVQGRKAVPSTSFKRLMGTPEVRDKLGVEVQDGRLYLLAPAARVAKAFMHVVDDLTTGRTKVTDIYLKPQRIKYAKKLPTSVVVKPTLKSGRGIDISTGEAQEKPKKKVTTVKTAPPRDRLIPRDCVLGIADPRCADIERELRRLKLADVPNAISVLFRVFVELSADAYGAARPLQFPKDPSLSAKLNMVADDLITRQKLSQQQAKAVRRAAQADSLLAASTHLMNSYVHNQYIFPGPADLRAGWNNLQPFLVAIWST